MANLCDGAIHLLSFFTLKIDKIESASCENNLHKTMAALVDALAQLMPMLDDAADLLELKRQCKTVVYTRLLEQYVQQSGSTIGCFQMLPHELTHLIAAQLNQAELLKFATTCKYMYEKCWECAPDEIFERLYQQIERKRIEKIEGKSYRWHVLAHRIVDSEKYGVPLITPCTFGNYTGDFVDGEHSGFGVYIEDDRRYTGWYLNGTPHGPGKTIYTDEEGNQTESYIGEYKYGKRHGIGCADDEYYIEEGQFVCGIQISGSWFEKESKIKYLGKCGQLGRATCTYEDGTVYTGYASNGRMHGECTIVAADWTAEAMMEEGVVVAAEYKLANGDRFLKFGEHSTSLDGHYRYTYADGSVDVGVWREGVKKGTFFHYDCAGNRTVQRWKEGHLME
jgi:hypothetical protein